MLKLQVRTSTCVDFNEFLKIVTGPSNSMDKLTPKDYDKFSGYAQKTKAGNFIGAFVSPEENAIIISMIRKFIDGGEQRSSFYISKESADALYNILGKLLKGK